MNDIELMLRRILLSAFFISMLSSAYCQYDPFVSLYMFNQMFYNPGYAGDGNEIEAKALGREQWMGFDGAPTTFFFNLDAPFKLFNQRHGVGLSIYNDEIGYSRNTGLNLSYAYRKSFIQGDLGIGVGLNMISLQFIDGTNWITSGDDVSEDPSIPETSEAPMIIDFNFGLYYSSDNLFLSLSGRNLANAHMKFKDSEKDETFVGRQVYLSTAYDYQLSNPMFSLKPGIMVGTDFSSTQLSVSSIVTYNKRIYGGLAYKPTDAVSAIVGIDLPSGIEVAVCYDFTTSRLANSSSGSFEFMLGYSFNLDIDKDSRKYKSVRFL